MIDFSGKIIWVKDSEEADCLLKMAISQGYKPCIGEKAMTVSKLFSFTGDHVIRPCRRFAWIKWNPLESCYGKMILVSS